MSDYADRQWEERITLRNRAYYTRGKRMPPVRVRVVQWGVNITYATKRATRAEIEQLFGNQPMIRGNLRGRAATHLAIGVTDAGRKLTVAFIYYAETRTAYPITAWEQS